MRFGVALNWATLLTAGSAFGAAAAGGNLSPVFVAAWVAGWLVAALTSEGRFNGGWVLAVGLLAGPALGAAVISRGLDPVLGAVYFSSALLIARLLTRKGDVGHGQVHLLSLLVLAGGAAVSPDISYLLFFVCYLVTATFALLLSQLRREAGDAVMALPFREVVSRGLLWGTALLIVFALTFTGAVFLSFPRVTFGMGMARAAGGAQVGLSDSIELAGFGRLKQNDRVVMRVWPGDGEVPASSLVHQIESTYWRAQVMEHYEGRRWRSLERRPGAAASSSISIWPTPTHRSTTRIVVEVVTPLGVPVLPIPDSAIWVELEPRDARGARLVARHGDEGEFRTVGAAATPYRFTVSLDAARQVVDDSPPGPEHSHLEAQHPAIEALAARLFEEAGGDPARFAHNVEEWLATRFSYSSELPRDPSLTHFLMERQAGHCEYFATAMAVLLRLHDVPARVAVGFHGARWNPSGGYFVVRQGDAHAWVEVWREGVGWLRYEPTPPAGIGRGLSPASMRDRGRDLWDSLQARWARHVLAFDRTAQSALGRRVARAAQDAARAFEREAGGGPRVRDVVPWALGFALLIVAGVLVRRLWRGRARGDESSQDARRAVGVYRALLRELGRAGLKRAPSQTAEEVMLALEELEQAEEQTLSIARRIVARYHASRFGGRPMPPEEARHLFLQVRRIGVGLRASRTGSRRAAIPR